MVHVRLPLVNRDFLMTRVDCERLVRENSQCRELLLEAMRYHLAPERRCALSTTRTAERKPSGAEPYLFAVGKYILSFFLEVTISLSNITSFLYLNQISEPTLRS